MTVGLDEPQADGPGLAGPAFGGAALDGAAVRALLALLAVSAGLAAAWLAGEREVVLAALAVLLAAGNGYGKAYSP